MRKIMSLVLVMAMTFMLTSSNKRFTIYMIGDSTMADKNMKKAPEERGWGMVLQGFFTENVRIDNHAINGRSSKSFINEGRWQKVLDKMQPGDYLVIQFGHNDEKRTDSLRYTRPWQEFADNYRMFIRAAKEKGVTPIVMNCVARRNFFNAKTKEEIDDEALRSVNRDKYNGKDNTHYNVYGARLMTSLLVDEMAKVCPQLAPFVRHYDYVVSAKGRGNYLTLQEAVDATPMGKKTQILILDGTWQKPVIAKGKKVKLIKYCGVTVK